MNEVTVVARFAVRRLIRAAGVGVVFVFLVAPAAMAGARNSMAAAAQHAASAKAQAMTVEELLAAARKAYRKGRLVAPAHDNAIEYYEAVLRKEPGNRVARDALRESFPYAAAHVERSIAQNDFDNARREIELLARAEPTNYTLTILRDKLDAREASFRRARQQAALRTDAPGAVDGVFGTPADAGGNPVAASRHELTLQAFATSWIEITDAQGRVIDSRTLHPGDMRSYRAAGPLRVTLGNAEGVDVSADGKHLNVKPDWHSRVAHFEVFAGQ